MSMDVRATVISIIAQAKDLPEADVRDVSDLQRDLGMDSLDRLDAQLELEDEFDITIPDADFDTMRTVGDVVNYVIGALGGVTGMASARFMRELRTERAGSSN
jgi:acyl carrier protein